MTRLLRVVIVDDEAPAREGLRLRLHRERDVLVLGEYADPGMAVDAINVDPPDVVFLDIEMAGLDGFSLLERLDRLNSSIVFVTAYDQYAARAFEINAVDYLLKPVEQERLHDALERVRARVAADDRGELTSRVSRLVNALELSPASPKPPERIAIRVDDAIRFIDPTTIDYIDAAGGSVRIHSSGAVQEVRKSMGEMVALLDPARFVRIHRSTIVNVSRIRELQPYFHGEFIVLLHDGTQLKSSRSYREALVRQLGI
jgi:two-component system LytT family response regulator